MCATSYQAPPPPPPSNHFAVTCIYMQNTLSNSGSRELFFGLLAETENRSFQKRLGPSGEKLESHGSIGLNWKIASGQSEQDCQGCNSQTVRNNSDFCGRLKNLKSRESFDLLQLKFSCCSLHASSLLVSVLCKLCLFFPFSLWACCCCFFSLILLEQLLELYGWALH